MYTLAVARTPRTTWIDEGLRALARGGPDAVRIEKLAEGLGVTKGGFYGYFADREALLTEMLDRWEHTVVDDVIAQVDAEGADGHARLRALFALAASNREILDLELAICDWARRDRAVARRLRRVDNRRMDYLRAQFATFCPDEDEVEVRCLLTMSLFVGAPFVAADHGARSRAEVVAMALDRLLETG